MTGVYGLYALAMPLVWLVFVVARRLREHVARRRRAASATAGGEPVSLHPVIDPARCIGCGACANACPEGRILALIDGKAELVDPSACIGHGACKNACPADAIDLVFGTARRGVDIPVLAPNFETTVPGVFVAGELGGMGLIANAVEQGRRAIDAIATRPPIRDAGAYDVVIVGAGPAGLAATLAAKEKNLRALTLEQGTLGGTVARYPRRKIVMTRPATLPLYGRVRLRRVRKERLLDLWRSVVARTGISIRENTPVVRIDPHPHGFDVVTADGVVRTGAVLLATGRRGTPRRLGIPGESLPHVHDTLAAPSRWRGRAVLVIGGGDSAVETALSLARHRAESVTLACRGPAPTRARPALRAALDAAVSAGRVTLLAETVVRSIAHDRVMLACRGQPRVAAIDAVFVCVGGDLPTALLAGAGVAVETRYGKA